MQRVWHCHTMTEEKLILKCVTGGKHHLTSLTFHFECDDLHRPEHFRDSILSAYLGKMGDGNVAYNDMLMTLWWWHIHDVGGRIMLVTLCWWLFQWLESENLSPTQTVSKSLPTSMQPKISVCDDVPWASTELTRAHIIPSKGDWFRIVNKYFATRSDWKIV